MANNRRAGKLRLGISRVRLDKRISSRTADRVCRIPLKYKTKVARGNLANKGKGGELKLSWELHTETGALTEELMEKKLCMRYPPARSCLVNVKHKCRERYYSLDPKALDGGIQ